MRFSQATRTRRLATYLFACAAVGLAPGTLLGAVRLVPQAYPTIQAGIDVAAFGDTVLVAPGTYQDYQTRGTHTSCAFLKDGVILRSASGPEATTIDGSLLLGQQPSVVECAAAFSDHTLLEGFTITNHARGFRGLILFDRLRVKDCIFEDLDELGSSGGGANVNGDVIFENCRFIDCHANLGGGVYHANGTIEMYGCEVRDSGTIGVRINENGGGPLESAWIENCIFENCGDSGALSISYFVRPITVLDCTFIANEDASTGGGGLAMGGSGPKLVEGCLFVGNEATGSNGAGGGLKTSRNAVIRNNTFWCNAAYIGVGGSAIRFTQDGPYELSNNVFAGGIGEGGALEAQFGGVTSSCNVFWDNDDGYGIFFTPGATDREIDPRFCNAGSNVFTVHSDSPCLPLHSLGCGLIGAFGQGCGTVSIESESWGRIKSRYRGAK